MSELTKEKIYKKELIAGGATGNNNLERIRSLAGGGTRYVSLPIDSTGAHASATPLTYLHFYIDDEEVQFVGDDFTGFLYVPKSVLTQDSPKFTVRLAQEIEEADEYSYQLSVHALFEEVETDPSINIAEVNVDYSFGIISGFYHFVTYGRA